MHERGRKRPIRNHSPYYFASRLHCEIFFQCSALFRRRPCANHRAARRPSPTAPKEAPPSTDVGRSDPSSCESGDTAPASLRSGPRVRCGTPSGPDDVICEDSSPRPAGRACVAPPSPAFTRTPPSSPVTSGREASTAPPRLARNASISGRVMRRVPVIQALSITSGCRPSLLANTRSTSDATHAAQTPQTIAAKRSGVTPPIAPEGKSSRAHCGPSTGPHHNSNWRANTRHQGASEASTSTTRMRSTR